MLVHPFLCRVKRFDSEGNMTLERKKSDGGMGKWKLRGEGKDMTKMQDMLTRLKRDEVRLQGEVEALQSVFSGASMYD